jgi:hypothetical protein
MHIISEPKLLLLNKALAVKQPFNELGVVKRKYTLMKTPMNNLTFI